MLHAFHTRYYEYSNIICQFLPRSGTMAKEICHAFSASPSCFKSALKTCFLSQIYFVFEYAHQNHARVRLASHTIEQSHRDLLGEQT